MLLEVVPQFSGGEEYSVGQFLVVGVALLGLRQDLAYIVNGPLNGEDLLLLLALHHDDDADNPVCCRQV